jgi:hypothetical protein
MAKRAAALTIEEMDTGHGSSNHWSWWWPSCFVDPVVQEGKRWRWRCSVLGGWTGAAPLPHSGQAGGFVNVETLEGNWRARQLPEEAAP